MSRRVRIGGANWGAIERYQQLADIMDIIFRIGGERGIRTPGRFPVNGFQDRRFRPLSHLSGYGKHNESSREVEIHHHPDPEPTEFVHGIHAVPGARSRHSLPG